ncbi:MAG: thiamine diphosphokinase [Anaerolineales bacterium]|uniref:Thiamine diphosphokinase n=1 Tax=Candidatus Desulfolinea nitratireducens TaxID=2841698 RepID=A0A8J6TEV0_9CHLR|nr:thiamine diphosphokinase [Candidatus Desulfolinea nitratireducens]MBL6959838.1 thiamine diphosphokinase [Anaerolineales bacterium]
MSKRALIFINGDLPDLDAARRILEPDAFMIAVDGGTRHLLALGLLPSVVIGDLDSLDPAHLLTLEKNHVEIIQHPKDKDETDLELALNYALDLGYRNIRLVAALGGRLDHTLGNLSLLTNPSLAGLELRIEDGVEEAFFVRRQAQIHGRAGETVSLLPWNGDVTGIQTEGLRWPLRHETLKAHKTRGISNEMVSDVAKISIDSGLLLCIHSANYKKE